MTGRRAVCATCLRAESNCICHWVRPLATAVDLLILQHPLECGHAKGSARLLHLSAPGSAMAVGELFAPTQLQALLEGTGGRQAVLLYPDTPDASARAMPSPPALAPALLAEPGALRLVVLDGTWRKSRKMLYLNPLLHALPRLPLRQTPASRYRIRKAHAPDQLSTLEATCHALLQLEGERCGAGALLDAFDGFVAQQARFDARLNSA